MWTATEHEAGPAQGGPQAPGVAQRGVDAIAASEPLDGLGRPLQEGLRKLFRGPTGVRVKSALNGTWLGHPLHPAVTDIPLGTWTAATAFDALTLFGKRDYSKAAETALVIGIAGAVASAVTGIADWADTGARQRRVGLVHAGLNTVALCFQIASVVGRRRNHPAGPVLSTIGLGTAALAAYLGGELVFREGTQVSRNAWTRGPRNFVPVMAEAALEPGRPTRAEAGDEPVMLVKLGGEIFAMSDVCSHAGCPLSSGHIEQDTIVCPCHGSTYRIRDGAVLRGPSAFNQPTLEVRVEAGQIEVRSRPEL